MYKRQHIYKINGRYYVFFIHSLPDKWFRTEACFSSDSLEGEFTGGDVLQDDMEYRNSGVAQGLSLIHIYPRKLIAATKFTETPLEGIFAFLSRPSSFI